MIIRLNQLPVKYLVPISFVRFLNSFQILIRFGMCVGYVHIYAQTPGSSRILIIPDPGIRLPVAL